MRQFRDRRTGRLITQLTDQGNNVHLYFTENSFDLYRPEIIFRSDRASKQEKAPHENPHYNLFRLNYQTGEMTQLTDEDHPVGSVTKTPDSELIAYITGGKVKLLDTRTGKTTVLYEENGGFNLYSPSISSNRRYVGFARNERVQAINTNINYGGFKESFYQIKDGRITLAHIDGSGHFDAYCDTHWLGHFQFAPDDPTLAMFCHEGPWNLVTQRIWLLDLVARQVRPIFRQDEQDSVGHEFWTQDGLIFFDNRGPNHDGTITSDGSQAVVKKPASSNFRPYVGLVDRSGRLVRQVEMPYYCNHYHANPSNTLLVGDDAEYLVLIDISTEQASLEVLCAHGTSWHTQASHCHPTFSWDGKRILYASDQGGRVNLYLLDL
ncbi:MAG: oligogalacturonate lyase family protein [Meiothermus sp.]|uniref:oligogalacturonate lyase family protein n=1 Tax=Meiothermus sp. TaxID=1955249 RepID=UPI0025D1D19B|nr:oligogalacturonate lyase family protein [Meiothermus sp.]MCS7069295.1 oligogalacturonate lyase family protein [Meiothermus sp.]MCX7601858.1 oligogalacturonate lyase family protein [Meiothermus sp.]